MQHWLKVMHRFRGAAHRFVGDPHRLGGYGEPLMRPAYEPGDLALVYVAGSYRCPAAIEIVAPPAFDPELMERLGGPGAGRRWGWLTEVRLVAEVGDIEDAPTLEEIGVPRVSVGRQSRLRLRPEQFAAGFGVINTRG